MRLTRGMTEQFSAKIIGVEEPDIIILLIINYLFALFLVGKILKQKEMFLMLFLKDCSLSYRTMDLQATRNKRNTINHFNNIH